MRRTVKFFVGGKKSRNPSADLRERLNKSMKAGWKVVSVHPIRSNPRSRKNPMARRSKRTGRYIRKTYGKLSGPKYTARRRAASAHIGRTYSTSKGWMRITRSRIRRKAGSKIHHPAVAWSGRRGTIGYFGLSRRKGRKSFKANRFTNPRRRRGHRRNPGVVGAYVGGLTSAPMKIFGQLKSFDIKDVGFTAGGALVTYLAGGVLGARVMQPLLDKILPKTLSADSRQMIARVTGAALPYTAAFVVSRFVLKGSKYSTPLLLGGALASIVELIAPGKVGELLQKAGLGADKLPASLHGLGQEALAGPSAGMGAYVEAPSYSGVGTELANNEALAAYVEAPSYSGVGEDDALAAYVDAPSYSGVGGDIGSYLSAKNEYMAESYLDG
jgi:hypothetical protein